MKPSVQLSDVDVVRSGNLLLDHINWTIMPSERWVLLGPNGCGKTTLLNVVSSYLVPTRGTVCILGSQVGKTDLRELRKKIGYVGPTPTHLVREGYDCLEIVVTGKHASFVDTRWHPYSDDDFARAQSLLDELGIGHMSRRTFDTMSDGERKRVLIARAQMPRPSLLLLDEPNAGLDLGAREQLVASLDALSAANDIPIVLVTHHVDDIPPNFTHAHLLSAGSSVAAGPLRDVITTDAISTTFDWPIEVSQDARGRFHAQGVH